MKVKLSNHSEIGRGHLKNNIPCQDFSYSFKKNDTYVSVVCDGAGSCKYSQYGAEVIAKCISNLLCRYFEELYIISEYINKNYVSMFIVSEALNNLVDKSKELNCSIKDLSSTLLFVGVKNDRYLAGHIGDGVIGIIENEEVNVLSHPDNGEFANITYFITGDYAVDRLRIYSGLCGDEVKGFVLMTDGTSASMYHRKDKILTKACVKLINYLENNSEEDCNNYLKKILKETIKKRTIDDCSIALVSLNVKKVSKFSKFELKDYYVKKSINNILDEINKKYKDYMYNIGMEYYNRRELNNAKKYFEELVNLDNKPDKKVCKILTNVCYNLGNYYYKNKQYNDAEEYYNLSSEYCKEIIHDDSSRILNIIKNKASKCNFIKHRYEYIELLIDRGEMLYHKGDFKGALKKFSIAQKTVKRYKLKIDKDIDNLIDMCEYSLNKRRKRKNYRAKKGKL